MFEDAYRQTRNKAAELGTSVSMLVRGYLRLFVSQPMGAAEISELGLETEDSHRRRVLKVVAEEITANGGACEFRRVRPARN